MESRFTNIEIIAEILANSMDFYSESEFVETAEDLGVENPEELFEKYLSIDALERDNASFNWEQWVRYNVKINEK